MSEEPAATMEAQQIPLSRLRANPDNIRAHVRKDADFKELVQSIKANGVVQALTVVPDDENPDGYMIVAGHRRHLAADEAKLDAVPAVIRRDLDATKITELALIENLQRTDLSPVEEARGYFRLVTLGDGRTVKDIAKQIGRSAKYVGERLALLEMPKNVLKEIDAGNIGLGAVKHLRAALDAGVEGDEWDALVTSAKEGRSLEYAAERAIAQAQREAVIAEIREKCEAKGIPLVIHKGYGAAPQNVRILDKRYSPDVPEFTGDHKDEPCEGVLVTVPTFGSEKPKAAKACLDFARHSRKGESEVKVKTPPVSEAEKARKDSEREARRAAAEAKAQRDATLGAVARGASATDTDTRSFIAAALIGRANTEQTRAAAILLGLEPDMEDDPYGARLKNGEIKKVKNYEAPLLRYADESNANLARVGTATALVLTDEFYLYGRGDSFTRRAKLLRNRLVESVTGDAAFERVEAAGDPHDEPESEGLLPCGCVAEVVEESGEHAPGCAAMDGGTMEGDAEQSAPGDDTTQEDAMSEQSNEPAEQEQPAQTEAEPGSGEPGAPADSEQITEAEQEVADSETNQTDGE